MTDRRRGEVVASRRPGAPGTRPDGTHYEIRGVGGSWFRYAGNYQWAWQRDFFDHGNAANVFLAMAKNHQLTPRMQERMKKGSNMPGWVRRDSYDWYADIAKREA